MTYSFNSARRASLLAAAAATLLAAMAAQAQTADAPAEARLAPGGQGGACPHPVNITQFKNSGPAQPDPSQFPAAYQTGGLHGGLRGSTYNQTVNDKWFGRTFQVPHSDKLCCQYRNAVLVVTYKVVGGGAANDGTRVYWGPGGANQIVANGADAAGHIWSSPPAIGQTVTHTFVIPANVVAGGKFSLWAQDDTAVVSTRLTVTGCCVEPTQPAK